MSYSVVHIEVIHLASLRLRMYYSYEEHYHWTSQFVLPFTLEVIRSRYTSNACFVNSNAGLLLINFGRARKKQVQQRNYYKVTFVYMQVTGLNIAMFIKLK
jgi:hypothetical protein